MKNPGNLKAHLVLRPGVFQVQQQRIFSNSFLIMDKMDSTNTSYDKLSAYSLILLFYSTGCPQKVSDFKFKYL